MLDGFIRRYLKIMTNATVLNSEDPIQKLASFMGHLKFKGWAKVRHHNANYSINLGQNHNLAVVMTMVCTFAMKRKIAHALRVRMEQIVDFTLQKWFRKNADKYLEKYGKLPSYPIVRIGGKAYYPSSTFTLTRVNFYDAFAFVMHYARVWGDFNCLTPGATAPKTEANFLQNIIAGVMEMIDNKSDWWSLYYCGFKKIDQIGLFFPTNNMYNVPSHQVVFKWLYKEPISPPMSEKKKAPVETKVSVKQEGPVNCIADVMPVVPSFVKDPSTKGVPQRTRYDEVYDNEYERLLLSEPGEIVNHHAIHRLACIYAHDTTRYDNDDYSDENFDDYSDEDYD